MADFNSLRFNRSQIMRGDGTGIFLYDSYAVAANPVATDRILIPVPAGFEIHGLRVSITDMDTSGSPTLAGSMGYAPRSGSTVKIDGASVAASTTYFRAASAFGSSAADTDDLYFVPIRFDDDAYITVVWTVAAATFAAGTIRVWMQGNAPGPV